MDRLIRGVTFFTCMTDKEMEVGLMAGLLLLWCCKQYRTKKIVVHWGGGVLFAGAGGIRVKQTKYQSGR